MLRGNLDVGVDAREFHVAVRGVEGDVRQTTRQFYLIEYVFDLA